MKLTFSLGILVIILAIFIYFIGLRKKHNFKLNVLFALVTCLVSIGILVFPLMNYDNAYLKAFSAFKYTINCIGMGQDLKIISSINLKTNFGFLYFIFIFILFVLVAILTISFAMSFIEKLVASFKILLSKRKKIYIFSELNEKSLMIAKALENNKKTTIIFANVKEKSDLNLKAVKLNRKITDVILNNTNLTTIYMISKNEEQNLNEALKIIDKYKNHEKIKMYIVNKSKETPIILDSTDKGRIIVEIINETERSIFNLLNDSPLFLKVINKTISILIVGCGNTGKEFLINSVWCSMMPGYKLNILVIDTNADSIKESINIEMKELLNNYNITFINANINSDKALNSIRQSKDINYILVSTDRDDKNISIAIMLRELFIREFDREPVINLYIENEYKRKQILSLTNEKGYSYNLNAFGGINYLYDENYMVNSLIEKLAIQIHLSYDQSDLDLYRYNLKEYNKRASRACALHIKYKLYSILESKYTSNMVENQKLLKEMYDSKIENVLVRNEHDRWVSYMRSIGYVCASFEDVSKYFNKNKHYIHYLAKMHPALVPFEKLDDVSKEISKITKENINFKESDLEIIRFIIDKMEL